MKRLKYIICLFMIGAFLIGCSSEKKTEKNNTTEIKAFEIGLVTDSPDGGNHASEISTWSKEATSSHEDNNAPTTYDVSFEGIEYEGKYWRSITETYDTYQTDFYEIPGGWFAINAETNELVEIVCGKPEGGNLSVEQCHDIAETLAKKYININEYEFEIHEGREGESMHGFMYRKVVDGMITSEALSITVTKAGKVLGFSSSMLGEFDTQNDLDEMIETIDVLQSNDAIDVLDEKVKQIYPDSQEYDIKNKTLIKLEDGSYGIVYKVITEKKYTSENGVTDIETCVTDILICK